MAKGKGSKGPSKTSFKTPRKPVAMPTTVKKGPNFNGTNKK